MSDETKSASKEDVDQLMTENFNTDLEAFDELVDNLRHGEKTRLLKAIVRYPLFQEEFDSPDLKSCYLTANRIKDILISQGVKSVLENIVESTKQGENQ